MSKDDKANSARWSDSSSEGKTQDLLNFVSSAVRLEGTPIKSESRLINNSLSRITCQRVDSSRLFHASERITNRELRSLRRDAIAKNEDNAFE